MDPAVDLFGTRLGNHFVTRGGDTDADVVVVGHVGLNGVAQLQGLRRRLPLSQPVVVRWWSHRRQELPTGEDEMADWLGERWRDLDRWVVETGAGG